MNFHNPAQPYLRPRADSRFRKQLGKQKVFSLSGDRKLWLLVVKMLLVICPMLLAGNLWLSASTNTLEQSVQAVLKVRHELIESRMQLRAKSADLFSPERVRIIAEEQLSPHVPEKEQVMFF